MAEQPQEHAGDEMVTVERFRDMLQAEMAKGRLDSAGIRSFLAGENAGLLYGNGLDGVLLQVSAADEEDARAILNDPGPADDDVTTVA
jgi:Putative prokaryotic signal transducing protein